MTTQQARSQRTVRKEPPVRYAAMRVGPPAPSRASTPATLRTIQPLITEEVAPNRTVHLQGRPSLHGVDWRTDHAAGMMAHFEVLS